jgi:hypothetical protein
VTLYASELGVAISQACHATSENHEQAVLKKLLGELSTQLLVLLPECLNLLLLSQDQHYDAGWSGQPVRF